jgi:hypothetical protein
MAHGEQVRNNVEQIFKVSVSIITANIVGSEELVLYSELD